MGLLELKVITMCIFKNQRSRNTFQWLFPTLSKQNIQKLLWTDASGESY